MDPRTVHGSRNWVAAIWLADYPTVASPGPETVYFSKPSWDRDLGLDLNAQTRELMLSEDEADIQAGRLYESANFDAKGRAEYPDLLREAALHVDDDALAAALNRGGHE
jgi:hypothetical protein